MNFNQQYFNLNLKPVALYKTLRDKSLTSRTSHKKLSIDFTNTNVTPHHIKPKSLSRLIIPKLEEKSIKKPTSSLNVKPFLFLEHNSQNILDILNKRWDKALQDSLKIHYKEKFLDLLDERKQNVESLFGEAIQNLVKKLSSSQENNHLIDIIRLAFAEQQEIINFHEIFHQDSTIKPIIKTTESSKKDNMNSCDKFQTNFNDLAEMLRLLLKIFFKKFTDLTVFLENKEENVWFQRLNELKIKFRLDKKELLNIVGVVDEFQNLFMELLGKVAQLSDEKQQVLSEYQSLKKMIDKSFVFSKAETREILQKPQKEADFSKYSLDYLQKFEILYKKSTDDMRIRNEELTEELLKTKRLLDEKQEILNDILKKRKLDRNKLKKTHEDKEIQINFFLNAENSSKSPCLHARTNPLSSYLPLTLNAYGLSSVQINSLMNLMLSDKLFDDYQDFNEKNCIKPMRDYILEWFLSRFGNQTYAETLMRDFLASILNYSSENDRFYIFSKFCGINLDVFTKSSKKKAENTEEFILKLDENHEKSGNILMNTYYSSSQAVSIFIKLAYNHKYLEIKDQDPDLYRPLLPAYEGDESFITYEHTENLIRTVLREEFPHEELIISEILQVFHSLISSEKLPRVTRKNGGPLGTGGGSPLKRNSLIAGRRMGSIEMSSPGTAGSPTLKNKVYDYLIPFDIIAKFILDNMAAFFDKKMETVITSLRLQQSNRKIGDFFVEDYLTVIGKQFAGKTNRWLMNSFTNFILFNKNYGVPSISNMITNHCEHLLRSENNEKFYLETYDKKDKKNNEDIGELILMNATGSAEKNSPKKKKTGIFSNFKRAPSIQEDKKTILNSNVEDLKTIFEKHYDYVDSIILLQETYHNLKESIKREELSNEILYISHEIFRKDIMKFPHNLQHVRSNFWNKFVGFDRNDLIIRLENCWKTLRLMIDCVFSRGEKTDSK